MRRTAKTSAATVTMTSGVRRRRRPSRVSAERAVELPAVRRFTLIAPGRRGGNGAGLGRDADRDRARPGLDPHVLTRRARAAVELVRDLPVEPDRALRSVRRVGDARLVRPAASELGEGPGPFDRVLRGDHAELEEPVVRPRPGEGLDSAEYRADVPGEHARDPALEEALTVYLHRCLHPGR